MKYQGQPGTQMWDAWFLNDKETVHAFHLQMPFGESDAPETVKKSIGHIYSRDLLHWENCGYILPPPTDDSQDDDYWQKYTGSAVTKDDMHYVFYTMRGRYDGGQRIGLALSKDLKTFSRYEGGAVLEPDSNLLLGYENAAKYNFGSAAFVDCRDFLVVKNKKDGLYYGYFAAAADLGRRSPVGVIAVAVSDDLINWRDQSIAFVPRQNGVIEAMDVFEFEGKWYLTVLCGNIYNGRDSTPDDYVIKATTYAVADQPRGPFVMPEDNIFIGGPDNTGFTCRTVMFQGKLYVLYVDSSGGGWTLSLPKLIGTRDNKLVPLYTPLLEKLRTGVWETKTLRLISNSFAWNTFGGEFTQEEGKYCIKTDQYDYQAALFESDTPELPSNLEMKFDLTMDAKAAGAVFEADNQLYFLLLEPEKGRILLLMDKGFFYVAGREIPLENKEQVRIILIDGTIECYINDALVLQCGVPRFQSVRAGLVCDRGNACFENIEIYSLEK